MSPARAVVRSVLPFLVGVPFCVGLQALLDRSGQYDWTILLVNVGVIVLRRTAPDMERSFRVPMVPWFPIIGGALCIYLMTKLELVTWLRFFGWLAAGLIIYFAYGRTHSKLQQGDTTPEPAPEVGAV